MHNRELLFFFLRLIITTTVVMATAHIIPGLHVLNLTDLFFFGLILGLVNAVIRPILLFLTLPITIITLGLFALIVNAFTYWLASELSYGIYIKDIWGLLLGGGIVWITGLLTNRFLWQKYQ